MSRGRETGVGAVRSRVSRLVGGLTALSLVAASGGFLTAVPRDGLVLPGLSTSVDELAELAYADVVHYASLPGYPRTGTRGSDVRATWLIRELDDLGLHVDVDAFAFPRFIPRRASLDVAGFRPDIMPFYYSGTTPPQGLKAELVDVGLGTPLDFAMAEVAGRVALVTVPTVQNALTPTFGPAIQAARDAGAVAVVMALQGPGNHLVAQNADSRAGMCDLPVVIVGKHDGRTLQGLAGSPARIVLHADYRLDGTAHNIVATLPGASDDVVVVGTPYNGWFTSAAERGSGIGAFLALARHYASTGEVPPQTLVFVALGGHEVGLLGLERFIAANPDLLDRISTYVHLGGTLAGKHYLEVGDTVLETGLPEPMRAAFTSENPVLMAIAEPAFRLHGSGHLVSMAPSIQNPGEQQFMYRAGVPIVSLSGGHLYFHTPGDTPETTSAELLAPMIGAFRQIIDGVLATDADLVRSANVLADVLAGTSDDTGAVVHACS